MRFLVAEVPPHAKAQWRARPLVERTGSRSVEFIEGSAEAIPLKDASVDTVVTTWTLCSIPDAPRALRDMRRVLRPGGRLLFVEHGRAPDPNVTWWQDRLTLIWKRLGGGCHLNRAIFYSANVHAQEPLMRVARGEDHYLGDCHMSEKTISRRSLLGLVAALGFALPLPG
jgi:SAM-dependent methyltransferase